MAAQLAGTEAAIVDYIDPDDPEVKKQLAGLDEEETEFWWYRRSQYVRDLLITLNDHRARHQALPATWEDFLYKSANKWAKRLVKLGCLQRGGYPKDCGETVGYFPDKEITGKEIIDYWYQESELYNWMRPGFTPETQNFTQMIWKSTRHVAFARAFDEKGGVYVVAHYVPGGNGHGDFEKNIYRAIPDNYDYFASYDSLSDDDDEIVENDDEDEDEESDENVGEVEEVEVEKPPQEIRAEGTEEPNEIAKEKKAQNEAADSRLEAKDTAEQKS